MGEMDGRDMKNVQVLIIEDDKSTAEFFKTVLQLVGLESEIVLSAKQALERLSSSVPDIILLDIRLGVEISGEDILYQIRSNPRFDKTRVVVITAYPRLAEPISDLADLILLKPVETEQLKNLMQRLQKMDFESKFQGCRDPITELFNEEFFLARLDLAYERHKRRIDFYYAVITVEFQVETHPSGQSDPDSILALLREIASRLKKNIRPTDAAARLSGWKFVTLHEDLRRPEEVELIVKRLTEKLSLPYETCGTPRQMRFKIGSAVLTPSCQKSIDVLHAAQAAGTEHAALKNR